MREIGTDRLFLLSTCGTSLLSNGAEPAVRTWLTKVANKKAIDGAMLGERITACRASLLGADDAKRRQLSAELNGIGAVLERWHPREVQHLLVHTDTALGTATAEIVAEQLRDRKHGVSLTTASGLRTDDLGSFRDAVAHLTRDIEEIVNDYRAAGWTVVFNLTGGFKSLNGYLQALGSLCADRCVFLFEGGALIEIPRLPVRLDEIGEIRPCIDVFRRLAVGYQVRADEAGDVPDSLLMFDDGAVTTSVWGDVVWGRARRELFAEQLWPTLSSRIVLRPKVRAAFNELEPQQRVEVNDALDAFAAYHELKRPLLKSRAFKVLAGNPVPGSTHELYAWSTGATGRLFGHYDTGTFVFDDLQGHL